MKCISGICPHLGELGQVFCSRSSDKAVGPLLLRVTKLSGAPDAPPCICNLVELAGLPLSGVIAPLPSSLALKLGVQMQDSLHPVVLQLNNLCYYFKGKTKQCGLGCFLLRASECPEFKIWNQRVSLVNICLVIEILISERTSPCLWSVSLCHSWFSWSISTGCLASGWSWWSPLTIWTSSLFEHTSEARSSWWHVFVSKKAQRRGLISDYQSLHLSHWDNHTFPIFCLKDDFKDFLSNNHFRCLLEFYHCPLPQTDFCFFKNNSKRSSHCGTAETNLTRNPEVGGWIPVLDQWVKDLALQWAVM